VVFFGAKHHQRNRYKQQIQVGWSLFSFFTFLGGQEKYAEARPALPRFLTRWFPWRGQKLALECGVPGFAPPIWVIETGRFITIYPFKQFAPPGQQHSGTGFFPRNPSDQGRIAKGKRICLNSGEAFPFLFA